MAEVSAADTGVANSVNSIVRTVGTSIASATLSTVLAMFTIDGTAVARESVYTAAFFAGAVACLVVVLAALAIRSTPAARDSVKVAESEATTTSNIPV